MRPLAVLFLTLCLALPAAAQEREGDMGEGVDLLGEGARLLFRGLVDEMQPALRNLARDLRELDWNGIRIEDLDDYHGPEVLPNGDIILRRKGPDAPDIPDGDEIEI